ncbi:UV DNA damage repair endonuclease UvsE [Alicyclobacillus fastidiosus]|uniref:UV DNA damage repair endonuclease UvsE n=1 Tax=Alicyclobacillus fastidiosus TaxID=392011 RepID=A0ABY6ZDJ1_9BACL|nr:UV DNA damage repair endonuclease UvsE [Alicyclobacillus fastidiosus]WAH40958.1 UV DNA damage repair endonuclease UvsE [Alicyclobacillus fastidiosus]GMA62470.1 UV damage endonuclease UvsE [Alicyclobacillus fastidiosus]
MIVRFGFVAMALDLQNASPSKAMTLTTFHKIDDRKGALLRVIRIAQENLANTLRILKYAYYEGIHLYRFSSKLIPLYGHEVTQSVNFMEVLREPLEAIGSYVQERDLRVSFHPDHFTVLNSPKIDVFENALRVLERHVDLLETMGLTATSKLNIHVGGAYGDKVGAIQRLVDRWGKVPQRVKQYLIFENDDKTYTARDTLNVCQTLGVPMTLDVHHHQCNPGEDEDLTPILPAIFHTWEETDLVPKVHLSSPKSDKEFRTHADFVDAGAVCRFLDMARTLDTDIDIMIEAKKKDQALKQLMHDLGHVDGVTVLDGGTIRYKP